MNKEQTRAAAPERTQSGAALKNLTVTAVFIALTYVFTAFINVRLPIAANGGLIHLGNIPLFIGAILFGKKSGFLMGGIGMGLFDLLSGWTIWAPFTFVIVGLMGFVIGWITEKHRGFRWYLAAVLSACAIKIIGYYLAEIILYHSLLAPLTSVPGNLIQVGTAAVIVLPIIGRLDVAAAKAGLRDGDR